MTIRFRCYGLGMPLDVNGEYELPDGVTVRKAASIILKSDKFLQKSDAFPDCILSINQKFAAPNDILADGDLLSVLHTLSGG